MARRSKPPPVPTLGGLRRTTPWLRLDCLVCKHYRPVALAPFIIRCGVCPCARNERSSRPKTVTKLHASNLENPNKDSEAFKAAPDLEIPIRRSLLPLRWRRNRSSGSRNPAARRAGRGRAQEGAGDSRQGAKAANQRTRREGQRPWAIASRHGAAAGATNFKSTASRKK